MFTDKLSPIFSSDSVIKEKNIINFPKPYHNDFTPYSKYDFSYDTRQKCASMNSEDIGGDLRIGKVIILGDVSVGKTCLVNWFCYKMFNSHYKSTIGVDFEVENFNILTVPCTLQIWDTAGQERFRSIAQSYYRNAKAIVIVFDFSDIASLYNCKSWLKDALSSYSTVPFLFLVGTKKDAVSSSAYSNLEIIGQNFAETLNAEYWSVSSKTGENIDALFFRIAALVFEELILKEFESTSSNIPIGSELIVLKKKKGDKMIKFHNTCTNRCKFV